MNLIWRTTGILVLLLALACSSSGDSPPEEERQQIEKPLATTLIFPENNTECEEGTIVSDTQSRILFQWDISEHTDGYEVHVEKLEDGTRTTHLSVTNELEIVLERGKAYGWSVVSTSDSTDETAESEVWKFYNAGAGMVNYAPFPADLLRPENNEVVSLGVSESVLLDWEASDIDGDIVSYQVYLDKENPPIASVGTTSDTEITVGVIANETYYWYVQVTDGANNTSRSDVFGFTTQ
ncbi:MAG: hypothetical protein RIM83_09415 [Allomuricauda sp.]